MLSVVCDASVPEVVGPAIWNSLPDYLKDPDISFDIFRKYPKTYLYAHY